MANSRIALVCKHCGKGILLGGGYFGLYSAYDDLTNKLEKFFEEHGRGMCLGKDFKCSDDAREHFYIDEFEKGE